MTLTARAVDSATATAPQHTVLPPARPAERLRDDAHALAVARQLADSFKASALLRDQQRILPWAELDQCAHSGLLALRVPQAYGGAEVSYLTLARVVALISEADASIGQLFLSIVLASSILDTVGSEEQKRFFFGRILEGYRWGNGHAEAGPKPAGTTSTRIEATASGSYRVNGEKSYATGALFSHLISIGCVDAEGKPHTAILERHTPGLTILDDWDGFGQRTTASGTLILDNVEVPASHVLHTEQARTLSNSYGIPDLVHSAIDLGIARAALQDTVDYVRQHARPFARNNIEQITDDPYVLEIIGDSYTRLHAAEALLERGAALFDQVSAEQGKGPSAAVSTALAQAKILTTEVALLTSNRLFQLGGASSTRVRLGYDRHWRNARTHTVHDPVHWKYNLIGQYYLNPTAKA